MADVHSKEVRSYNMSRIGSKNTKPEIILRKVLFSAGFRFRIHVKLLPGRPDIVLKKYKTAIFVHGCFWHGHVGCKYYVVPKTRTEFWLDKINGNITKDELIKNQLQQNGWNVIEVWECQIKKGMSEEELKKLITKITNNANTGN